MLSQMKMLLRCSLSHPSLVPHLITKAFDGSFQFSQWMNLLNFTSYLGLQSKFQIWASGKSRFLRVGLAPRVWSYNRPKLGVKHTQWVFLGRGKQIRPYTLGTKLSPLPIWDMKFYNKQETSHPMCRFKFFPYM